MSGDFFSLPDCSASYLNRGPFIAVLERVYRITRRHSVVERDGEATGVPAFAVSSLLSGRKITSMPFNYYPPLAGARSNVAAVEHLVALARDQGGKCHAEYKTGEALPEEVCGRLGLASTVFSIVSDLPLTDDPDAQRKQYKSRHRTKVNKARRELAHLDVATTTDPQDLSDWYDLLLRLYRDKHQMICQPLTLYRQLLALQDQTTLLIAKEDGHVVGGLFLMHDAERWDYSWGAMHPNYDRRDLASLLLDHAIGMAIEAGAQTFSFGSSSPSDERLLFFKQRWGCVERPVHAYYWNHVPKAVDLNDGFSLARKLIARAPLPLLKAAPPLLVPHLT